MLYWFAEYLFGCDRLIMKNMVINSRMFCFVGYGKMKRKEKRQNVSETCFFCFANDSGCFGLVCVVNHIVDCANSCVLLQ